MDEDDCEPFIALEENCCCCCQLERVMELLLLFLGERGIRGPPLPRCSGDEIDNPDALDPERDLAPTVLLPVPAAALYWY